MNKLKVASFFAGVGGIDLGFERTGMFETVYANEFDPKAAQTMETNFPNITVDTTDVHDVKIKNIPEFDVMVGGFPCQAFSVAGYREGFGDKKGRGELFFELERIFIKRKPPVIFLENVKNLVGHDKGRTFKIILGSLHAAGYHVHSKVLNAMEYGDVPQNRERIYIVAFRDEAAYSRFKFPEPVPLTQKLYDVIYFEKQEEPRYYYTPEKCKFYSQLEAAMKSSDTAYQWRRIYVRENKSNVCPTLTANMGTGGHNVPLVKTPTGIRKLTPKECFNVMGFPDHFQLPNIANTSLYKQAGNSVVVPVIQRIAEQITKALYEL